MNMFNEFVCKFGRGGKRGRKERARLARVAAERKQVTPPPHPFFAVVHKAAWSLADCHAVSDFYACIYNRMSDRGNLTDFAKRYGLNPTRVRNALKRIEVPVSKRAA